MGLRSDIESALLKSLGPDAVGKGNIPEVAKDLSGAIINWITKQEFTITKMKAVLEIETMSTTAPLQADVLNSVQIAPGISVATSGGPGSTTGPGFVSSGKSGVLIPKIKMGKTGGQGGSLSAKGHAYIGRNPVPGNETNEDETTVKLLPFNVTDK